MRHHCVLCVILMVFATASASAETFGYFAETGISNPWLRYHADTWFENSNVIEVTHLVDRSDAIHLRDYFKNDNTRESVYGLRIRKNREEFRDINVRWVNVSFWGAGDNHPGDKGDRTNPDDDHYSHFWVTMTLVKD